MHPVQHDKCGGHSALRGTVCTRAECPGGHCALGNDVRGAGGDILHGGASCPLTPVLAFPDFSREFMLETDISGAGLGTVLPQKQEDLP